MNYPELPKSIRKNMHDLMQQHFNVDTWNADFEDIEYESRDGFIPFSHNHGGLQLRGFTNVASIIGSGDLPTHQGAADEINRQWDYNRELVAEDNPSLDSESDDFFDKVYESADDSESTVMYEIQAMYHGKDNNRHSMSISAAVNTEGPYHRRSISWAPKVFCEGATESEIVWQTAAEFKKKFERAVKNVVKQTF